MKKHLLSTPLSLLLALSLGATPAMAAVNPQDAIETTTAIQQADAGYDDAVVYEDPFTDEFGGGDMPAEIPETNPDADSSVVIPEAAPDADSSAVMPEAAASAPDAAPDESVNTTAGGLELFTASTNEVFTGATDESSTAAAKKTAKKELFSDEPTKSVGVSTNAATLACRGYSSGKIKVTSKVSRKITSKDRYYYLFQLTPGTTKLGKQVAKVKKPSGKNKYITFYLKTAGHPEYLVSRYALAVKTKAGTKPSSFSRISTVRYVSSPEKAATYKTAYKLPKTKKGLQTTNFTELKNTKSKTAFFNLPISVILANNAERVPYYYNGKKYYFNKIGGYTNLVRQCNNDGIQVTMQLLLDWTPSTQSLIAASAPGSSSAFYAWETTETASRQKMEALFCFLSELFGSDSCYVSNWVLGNEINSSSIWNYPGNMSKTQYVNSYTDAFRCLYNAVRGTRASSKVFICLDHYWNTTVQGYAGKDILNSFAKRLRAIQANVNWNLAYHAYPFPLTEPKFWAGYYPSHTTNNSNSPVISLNNLSALTNYIKGVYGSDTRIIISEVGFTSSKGQSLQAASLALGYYIAACNPMVDAFHVRSYQDESHEVAQGLAFGLKGKSAWKVFLNMDSSKTLTYTKSHLTSQVGTKWTSKVPYYKLKRLYTMYRNV